ncbi:protein ROOT INITIATION DEFECTIVE 3-like [Hibiscus syriacus]|uniref:protein ROOT INITIATION DEFECTIVE 3-like n=1 Tax=Hibiscus syriacus TaxID=106335 RepID=UPI0019242E21|nr:protein ROOT INITIATION DEFECTIVE 3-like [Hibiscus syriacus]XP_039049914.1 protein ROOT INITIATION DEFECTIVE 3-like [Hibiscus syriacus]
MPVEVHLVIFTFGRIFDDDRRQQASHLYEQFYRTYSDDIVMGYGGDNAVIVSASEDRTCKVGSLSRGRSLRNIVFPSMIDAIALDPITCLLCW